MKANRIFIIVTIVIFVIAVNGIIAYFVVSRQTGREYGALENRVMVNGQAGIIVEPEPITLVISESYEEGNFVEFGEFIWRVLEVRDDKAFLLSEFVIDYRAYHGEPQEQRKVMDLVTTWAQCDLRAYLNGEFLESFSEEDRARIVETHNENQDNQWFGASGGEDSDDYIFLLSLEEVMKYFGDSGLLENRPERRYALDDQYNTARRAFNYEGRMATWWLRSPGSERHEAVNVEYDGTIYMGGHDVNYTTFGVRPAMWVEIEAEQ
jgi:hypothetical protein